MLAKPLHIYELGLGTIGSIKSLAGPFENLKRSYISHKPVNGLHKHAIDLSHNDVKCGFEMLHDN